MTSIVSKRGNPCLVIPLLLVVTIPVTLGQDANISLEEYPQLITEVHEYYRSSCIILIRGSSYNGLAVESLMRNWLMEFSQQGISSVAMELSNMINAISTYYLRGGRPMFVVLLDSKDAMNEFANSTKYLKTSFPVWFVMFMEEPSGYLKEFCQHPRENLFNLMFNTEMIVFCHNYSILQEWYALKENHTKVFNIANWTPKEGLTFTTTKSLYARRGDMLGETMRIAIVEESPFVGIQNNTLIDFFGSIFVELSKVMNFSIKIMNSTGGYGSWNKEMKAWTGVIGDLVHRDADVGVAEFTMTNTRLQVVDYTIPLFLTHNRIYLKKLNGETVQWSQYLKAFDFRTWLVIIAIITIAPILLTLMKTKGYVSVSVMAENYIHIWGIYCQQSLPEFPYESSLRVAFFSIFMSALIVSSAYSASLISFLTVVTSSLPFSSMEGFADDGTYKLIVFKNTADYDLFMHSNDSVFLRLKALMKKQQYLPLTLMEGLQQVCTERVGFYTVEEFITGISKFLPCQIDYVETGKVESLAMTLYKGNPYKGLINYHLQRFQDYGIMNRLRAERSVTPVAQESNHEAVTLWDVAPILALVAGGIILAGFILLIEKMYYSSINSNTTSQTFFVKVYETLNSIKEPSKLDSDILPREKNNLDSQNPIFGYRP